jgi:hypothetical protein
MQVTFHIGYIWFENEFYNSARSSPWTHISYSAQLQDNIYSQMNTDVYFDYEGPSHLILICTPASRLHCTNIQNMHTFDNINHPIMFPRRRVIRKIHLLPGRSWTGMAYQSIILIHWNIFRSKRDNLTGGKEFNNRNAIWWFSTRNQKSSGEIILWIIRSNLFYDCEYCLRISHWKL